MMISRVRRLATASIEQPGNFSAEPSARMRSEGCSSGAVQRLVDAALCVLTFRGDAGRQIVSTVLLIVLNFFKLLIS